MQFWLRHGKKKLGLRNSLLMGVGQDQQQHMLRILGELAGGGSVAVAVCVGDM